MLDCVKLFVQTVQANGFSPVCVRLCFVRLLDDMQRALCWLGRKKLKLIPFQRPPG